MLTLNDTPLNDPQAIWLLKVITDSTTFYLATEDITISGQAYDGEVILHDSIGDIDKSISLDGESRLGNVGNFSFAITRSNPYSGLSNFINDLYPDTSVYLTGARVFVGVCWEGADGTANNDVTWIGEYRIEDPEFTRDYILCSCIDFVEYENSQLPYYEIQKSYNNEVSYFPNAPSDVIGTPIPLLYGDYPAEETHTGYAFFDSTYLLHPCIVVDPGSGEFVIASHEISSLQSSSMHKYSSGIDNFLSLTADISGSNGLGGSRITLLSSTGSKMYGATYLHPSGNLGDIVYAHQGGQGNLYSVVGGDEIYDRSNGQTSQLSSGTYFDLTAGSAINLRFDTESLESFFNTDAPLPMDKIKLKVYCKTITGSTELYVQSLWPGEVDDDMWAFHTLGVDGKAIGRLFTISTSAAFFVNHYIFYHSKSMSDLFEQALRLYNQGSNTLRIYEAYFHIEDIKAGGSYKKPQGYRSGNLRPSIKFKLGGIIG